jgi:hypothetical protein
VTSGIVAWSFLLTGFEAAWRQNLFATFRLPGGSNRPQQADLPPSPLSTAQVLSPFGEKAGASALLGFWQMIKRRGRRMDGRRVA